MAAFEELDESNKVSALITAEMDQVGQMPRLGVIASLTFGRYRQSTPLRIR